MINEYFEEQEKLEKEFGPQSVVLFMVGHFHECYEYKTKKQSLGKCHELSPILNMITTLKDKSEPHSKKNCYMLGFPSLSLSKNIDILLKNNWVVSIWNQEDIKNSTKKNRKHYQTLTPSTFLDEINYLKKNNLMSLYLYAYNCKLDRIDKIELNICIIDLNNGEINSYLFNNKEEIISDELNEIINFYEIKEIIYISNTKNYELKKIIHGKNEIKIYNKEENLNYKNKIYQKEILKRCFKTDEFLLDYPDLIYSLIYLITFINLLDKNLINNLKIPNLEINKYETIINYDTINQLNLIPSKDNNKYKSIYDIINNCSTVIGKRELKNRIIHPITDIDELNLRYKKIENLQKDKLYK
jgi:DNA mismatch repair protein MutS